MFLEVYAVKRSEYTEATGISNVIAFMDAGGVPNDKIMQSIELFGTKVMPALQ